MALTQCPKCGEEVWSDMDGKPCPLCGERIGEKKPIQHKPKTGPDKSRREARERAERREQ